MFGYRRFRYLCVAVSCLASSLVATAASASSLAAARHLWHSPPTSEAPFSLWQADGKLHIKGEGEASSALQWPITANRFDISACSDGYEDYVALGGHLAALPEQHAMVVASSQGIVAYATVMPLAAAPAAFMRGSVCRFVWLTTGGEVIVSDPTFAEVEHLEHGVAPFSDLSEWPRGALLAAQRERVIVGDPGDGIFVYDLQQERSERHALGDIMIPGAVFSEGGEELWFLGRKGTLYTFRPFSGQVPQEVARGDAAVTSGLTPWHLGKTRGLLWGDLAGRLFLYDGDRLHAHTLQQPIVWPILTARTEPERRPFLLIPQASQITRLFLARSDVSRDSFFAQAVGEQITLGQRPRIAPSLRVSEGLLHIETDAPINGASSHSASAAPGAVLQPGIQQTFNGFDIARTALSMPRPQEDVTIATPEDAFEPAPVANAAQTTVSGLSCQDIPDSSMVTVILLCIATMGWLVFGGRRHV